MSGIAATYTTGGSVSSRGYAVQYWFDWGDGTNSGWLSTGTTGASHSWSAGGTFSVKAQARSTTGVTSSWSGVRSVVVQQNYAPTSVGVSPSWGTGISQVFTFTVSDGNGWDDISDVQMWIGLYPSCHFLYAHLSNTLWLVNDSETAWVGSVPPGGATLSNSQCTVSLGQRSGSGNQLSVPVGVTFRPQFAGAKNVYMATADKQSVVSPFVGVGTWTAPATVQLTDLTHPGGPYRVGDSFVLSVSGPPNSTVTVTQTANGVPGTEWPMGQTDGSGNYSVSGTWDASNVGTFTQLWRAGGVDATPVLSFSIIP